MGTVRAAGDSRSGARYERAPISARRKPLQRRSTQLVDAILEAAIRVLSTHGPRGFTTVRVAREAGVSVGSLYQYFPNKEALVAALIEHHVEAMNAAVLSELTRVARLPMVEAVRAVIELTIGAHAVEPELHRVLTEQVPRVGRLSRLLELEQICHRMVASVLAARKDELAIQDPDLTAYICCTAIEAIAHRSALLSPERLKDPRLIDEAVALVTRYLGVAAN
jgi:AcrR family transcriptional regulator